MALDNFVYGVFSSSFRTNMFYEYGIELSTTVAAVNFLFSIRDACNTRLSLSDDWTFVPRWYMSDAVIQIFLYAVIILDIVPRDTSKIPLSCLQKHPLHEHNNLATSELLHL